MVKRSNTSKAVSPFSIEPQLREAISTSTNYLDVIQKFFPEYTGGTGHYRTLKKYIHLYNIDIAHFSDRKQRAGLNRHTASVTVDLQEIFEGKHPHYSRHRLKQRLIKENIIPYECNDCGLKPEWNGKPLSLQLEHINGVSTDNRLNNLCFLCPNCHSQTPTYAGKGAKKPPKPVFPRKPPLPKPTKINWPSNEDMAEMVMSQSIRSLSSVLGVSDNSIRKHCIIRNIPLPTRGKGGMGSRI